MTSSRGGARPGAGRKKKAAQPQTETPPPSPPQTEPAPQPKEEKQAQTHQVIDLTALPKEETEKQTAPPKEPPQEPTQAAQNTPTPTEQPPPIEPINIASAFDVALILTEVIISKVKKQKPDYKSIALTKKEKEDINEAFTRAYPDSIASSPKAMFYLMLISIIGGRAIISFTK